MLLYLNQVILSVSENSLDISTKLPIVKDSIDIEESFIFEM